MDANSNIHGDYGEKFWDDVMNTSAEGPGLSHSVEVPSTPEGVDILQQSLKEANILDASNNSNSLCFDDFGFTFNNHSNNSNVSKFDSTDNNLGAAADVYSSSGGHSDNAPGSFDISEYLNITTAATASVATNTVVNKPLPGTSTNIKFASHPQAVIHHQPFNIQQTAKTQISSFSNQTAFSTVVAKTTSKPTTYIQLQLTRADSFATSTASPKVVASSLNTQFVISSIQTIANLSGSYTVQPLSTVQSKSVAVCSSTFTRTITHPITTTMYSASSWASQVVTKSFNVSAVQTQPVLHQIQTPSVHEKHTLVGHEDQVNKLASLLQSKAASRPDMSGKFLKVGNQNIDVSDPTVAKALASKILQQKLNQQKQNQVTVLNNVTQSQSINRNITVINLPVTGIKNSVLTSSSQLVCAQVPNVSTSGGIPQNNVIIKNNELSRQHLKSASPVVSLATKVSPVVQLLAKDNSSPANRFQIASVNISRPSSLPNQTNIQPQRINSPVHHFVTLTTASATNIVKPNPVQGTATPPSVVTTTAETGTLVKYLGTWMRLNLTPQQVNSLSSAQLQKLYMQHQAAVNARKPVTASITQPAVQVVTCVTASVQTTKPLQTPSSETSQDKLLTFRVDPNLTSEQVDEVQKVILKKVPLKVHQLSVEQKQLLSAFRAQLRTMEPTIQQYYLRNPHLFLQKVFQHVQNGKPFLFQVKVDQNKTAPSTTNHVTSKSSTFGNSHPTITLGTDAGRLKGVNVPVARPSVSVTPTSRRVKRSANIVADVPVMQSVPAKRPSLRLLMRRCKMNDQDLWILQLCKYDLTLIKEDEFIEGEKLYDKLADVTSAKFRKMLNKYHTLCLKDAAMEVCSADRVLLDRAFLQHEKACLFEMKQTLKDDPDAILSYLPQSYAKENPDVIAYLKERVKSKLNPPSLLFEEERKVSQSNGSISFGDPVISEPTFSESNFVDGQQSQEDNSDLLLQEAVESILS